jgi:hypothetical protein
MAKLVKAEPKQAKVKIGIYGKSGSGKTFTSLLLAEGLAKREGKRIAFVDSERGTDYYSMDIAERTIHPKAFDFDRIVTRSMMEALEVASELDTSVYGVLVIDSITHFWEAAREAYMGKKGPSGQIPIQAWAEIKKPYKKLMAAFLDKDVHAILCGREGLQMEKDEDGDMEIVGTKMKAEGETAYEPHMLARFAPRRDAEGGYIISAFWEKDRSGILTGRTTDWPNYQTIEPITNYLSGTQGTIGSIEESAEKDAAAIEAEGEKALVERDVLSTTIRTALESARSFAELKSAWSLTAGKKTKLGDRYDQLETIHGARKAEILKAA